MGQVPAHFRTKQETGRRIPYPVLHRLFPGKVVEAAVDLGDRKMLSVPGQPIGAFQFFGIEQALPILIAPTGCSDMYFAFCHRAGGAIFMPVLRGIPGGINSPSGRVPGLRTARILLA